jgi:hypothetical protein
MSRRLLGLPNPTAVSATRSSATAASSDDVTGSSSVFAPVRSIVTHFLCDQESGEISNSD